MTKYGKMAGAAITAPIAIYDSWYKYQAYKENKNYWNDYKKNTGFSSRYPYRSGQNANVASFLYPGAGATSQAVDNLTRLYE